MEIRVQSESDGRASVRRFTRVLASAIRMEIVVISLHAPALQPARLLPTSAPVFRRLSRPLPPDNPRACSEMASAPLRRFTSIQHGETARLWFFGCRANFPNYGITNPARTEAVGFLLENTESGREMLLALVQLRVQGKEARRWAKGGANGARVSHRPAVDHRVVVPHRETRLADELHVSKRLQRHGK